MRLCSAICFIVDVFGRYSITSGTEQVGPPNWGADYVMEEKYTNPSVGFIIQTKRTSEVMLGDF